MIEQLLMQGGAFGILSYLIYYQTTTFEKVISNNTTALIKNANAMRRLKDAVESKK